MRTPPAPEWAHPLPKRLARMKGQGNVAALTTLRRALRRLPEHADPAALPYVIPYVRPWPSAQDAGLLLAGLWAQWHHSYHLPVNGNGDLGGCLARLETVELAERHMSALVNAAPATLPRHLSAAVNALAREQIVPDWSRLHADVVHLLEGRGERVRRRWLTNLYLPAAATDPESVRAHA